MSKLLDNPEESKRFHPWFVGLKDFYGIANIFSNALQSSNFGAEPMLRLCGVSISSNFSQVEGRVLPTPRLKVSNGKDLFPWNG